VSTPEAPKISFQAMACRCELQLAGAPAAALEPAARSAIAEVRRIEQAYSRYRADSIVSRINAAAGSGQWVDVDDETQQLLGFAQQLHDSSGGLFDISSGVLRRAWDFRTGRVPADVELQALLPLVGWQQVERRDHAVRLPRPGMELDFGGFGKEYAADRAAGLLLAAGVRQGYVNLGGDIRVLGPRPDGGAWRFGIQHPRQPGTTLAVMDLAQGALATSGDYERFFEVDGRRYCHILHPRTGWPVQHWQSVSVQAPLCVAAGAFSTIAMLLGPQAGAFLNAQQVPWLAVDASGTVAGRVQE
jgi:thiamine biosynthesis lipoprotein